MANRWKIVVNWSYYYASKSRESTCILLLPPKLGLDVNRQSNRGIWNYLCVEGWRFCSSSCQLIYNRIPNVIYHLMFWETFEDRCRYNVCQGLDCSLTSRVNHEIFSRKVPLFSTSSTFPWKYLLISNC